MYGVDINIQQINTALVQLQPSSVEKFRFSTVVLLNNVSNINCAMGVYLMLTKIVFGNIIAFK